MLNSVAMPTMANDRRMTHTLLAASIAMAGCGEHAGPTPGTDLTALNDLLYCPAEIITLSPQTERYTGSFAGAARWLNSARGYGPQAAFLIPPHTCTWQLETCGSSVDTVLSIASTCVASANSFDNDRCSGGGEQIILSASTAPTYLALGSFATNTSGSWILTATGCTP